MNHSDGFVKGLAKVFASFLRDIFRVSAPAGSVGMVQSIGLTKEEQEAVCLLKTQVY
jgi:phosphotransacetylase